MAFASNSVKQVPASTLRGNASGSTGPITDLTAAQVKTMLAISSADVSGLLAASDIGATVQAYDADLAAIAALSSNGLAKKTGAGTWTIDAAAYLTANQTVTISGDASGSGSTAITLTLPSVNGNVGTFNSLTVNAKGQVTAASNVSVSTVITQTEINLGSTPRRSGRFTISGSGWTIGKNVIVTQSPGPYTGKGTRADESEMDVVSASGIVTASGTITVYWQSATRVVGNRKFIYTIGA